MALSWNEIKNRALKFSNEWKDETSEEAEAKSFWDDFFQVFGISRRRVATFETRVTKNDRKNGYIDLLWKGQLLVEHKSAGKDLDRAYSQATDYFQGLKEHELPKYIIVCNFEKFRIYDLDESTEHEFLLEELVSNVHHFGFIAGYQKRNFKEEDPVNIEAAQLMAKLHDRLKEVGYTGHNLEQYLVRLLFCLFADDTGIFERGILQDYIEINTKEDGSDLAYHLAAIFNILNTEQKNRLKNVDESLAQFPYVNGKLFEENLPMASFDKEMRLALLDCCKLDWGKISPAIFGSLFQGVMNPVERRNLGAHYTSEKNILKLIKPLFLDDLIKEFENIKNSRNKLIEFHKKISKLKFLDPACGCGNFLVITYRELRLLEIEILRVLNSTGQRFLDVSEIIWLDVDMMYGIEYEEFPARIAEVAMWLIDHQMNMIISQEFGQYFARLPLRKAAYIKHCNALRIDWEDIISQEDLSFILGNPPFYGKQLQTKEQKEDMELIFKGVKGAGVLDYVSAWYIKAAQYIINTPIRVAFVSTNSITQGEQVGILWNELINKYKVKIHFAHRTFKWFNEAKGNATVHVVIVGFANHEIKNKFLYEYEDIKEEPHELSVKNINPYLVNANDLILVKRRKPICSVPEISFGSMPNDGGEFLLSDDEKNELLLSEPKAESFIKPLVSAHEFLNGKNRWCLWLEDISPVQLRELKIVHSRVQNVKNNRLKSSRAATKKLADFPTLFGENRQPKNNYILIPLHSSENRNYIPLGFFNKDYIANNSCSTIDKATLYHFGILHSEMHMSWVKNVCGRLESRYRYSNELVYNNYPWPINPTKNQIKVIETAAQKVLDVRDKFEDSCLADLYDPFSMPPALVKAHQALDKVVDLAYRPQPFANEAKRMEFLFELYEKYNAELFKSEKPKRKR